MIEWGQKSKPIKIPWASNKTTPKIPGQNFTSKKSHAEFPNHKNFQKALKKHEKWKHQFDYPKSYPQKIFTKIFSPQKNPEMENFKPKKILRSSLSLKSAVPPSGAREVRYKSRKPVITSKQYFKGYRCLPY